MQTLRNSITHLSFSYYSKGLLFFCAYLLVLTILYLARESIASAVTPLFEVIASSIENRYQETQLSVVKNGDEWVYQLRYIHNRPIVVYGQQLPFLDVQSHTLVTHSLTHLAIFTGVFLYGLVFRAVNPAIFIPGIIAGALLSVGLDIPLTLVGSIEGLMLEYLAPDQLGDSWLVKAEQFMMGGGRYALPIFLALLSLQLAVKKTNSQTD